VGDYGEPHSAISAAPCGRDRCGCQRYRRHCWMANVLKTANADGTHLYDVLVGPARNDRAQFTGHPDHRRQFDGLNFETLLAPASLPQLHSHGVHSRQAHHCITD